MEDQVPQRVQEVLEQERQGDHVEEMEAASHQSWTFWGQDRQEEEAQEQEGYDWGLENTPEEEMMENESDHGL